MKELGKGQPFLIVYYGSDGSGGWQPLDRPLRTLTALDRFGLVTWNGSIPMLRMLQVPELTRAMGFDSAYILTHGSRRDRIRILKRRTLNATRGWIDLIVAFKVQSCFRERRLSSRDGGGVALSAWTESLVVRSLKPKIEIVEASDLWTKGHPQLTQHMFLHEIIWLLQSHAGRCYVIADTI